MDLAGLDAARADVGALARRRRPARACAGGSGRSDDAVAAIEWLRLLPKPGLRPQMEQTLDIGRLVRISRDRAAAEPPPGCPAVCARPRNPRKMRGDATATIESDDRCAHRRRCARTRAPRRFRRRRCAGAARHAHRRHQRLPGARRRHGREPLAHGALGATTPCRRTRCPSRPRSPGSARARRCWARAATRGSSSRSSCAAPATASARAAGWTARPSPMRCAAPAPRPTRALREPVEGTILTVARALADGAEAARSDDPIITLAAGLAAAEIALARTPDMLPVLREAGVVDAGGAGLVELVRGALAALRGEPIAEAAPLWEHAARGDRRRLRRAALLHRVPGRRRVPARAAGAASSRRSATRSSSSPTASSCAPTCTPTTPASHLGRDRARRRSPASRSATCTRSATRSPSAAAAAGGALEDDGRLADVLAIVDGDGNRVLYASLGARLLLSGRPTADELLDAIRTSPAAGIVLLPNDRGLQVVAEYAAQAASMPVHVVPSRGLAQGLAALVAYRTDQPAAVLAAAFAAAAAWARERRGARRRGQRRGGAARGRAARARARLHARHGAGRRGRRAARRWTRSRTWLARGASGCRARAARRRSGAPALLRERRVRARR